MREEFAVCEVRPHVSPDDACARFLRICRPVETELVGLTNWLGRIAAEPPTPGTIVRAFRF